MTDEKNLLSEVRSLIKNKGIKIIKLRKHMKASEVYVDVVFSYPKYKWIGSVPIEYRRAGTFAKTAKEIAKLLLETYNKIDPINRKNWLMEQKKFWKSCNKKITEGFFAALSDLKWHCVNCQLPPNPNWARRTQDIKEFGYTLATETGRWCKNCNKKTTQLILLPLPRGAGSSYETFSSELRKKIIRALDSYDAYEGKKNSSMIPDHKFPEIRWDETTPKDNSDNMPDDEIRNKFQLLSNQRNEQKREVCRRCFQTNKRGTAFGILFFYNGNEDWPKDVPKRGKNANRGCIGCPWFDFRAWRTELNRLLTGIKP
jgi:hypothetical protein